MANAGTGQRDSVVVELPLSLVDPIECWHDEYWRMVHEGERCLANAKVAFVGLARNCDSPLATNLERLVPLAGQCKAWCLHIEENDSQDQTVNVLQAFAAAYPQATYTSQRLDRRQYGAEFAGPRTIALAEYRDACQRWVRECASDADFVVVIDWDAWGGFSPAGVMNGIGWLVEMPGAYGMASVSLNEFTTISVGEDRQPKVGKGWTHYDAWALRGVGQAANYWDDYTAGLGGWKHQWLPPVGSPPVLVSSAFGGLCIYRTDAYLQGTYDGVKDCEHVPYHASIAKATGQHLYLNPSQRCIMAWMEPDGRQHSNH